MPPNIPVTPSTHRQRPGADSLGLSAVPGLVSGTPVSGTPVSLHGSGRVRQPSREIHHNQRTSTDGLVGVGLSSRLKASQASGPAGAFVHAARPRGELWPLLLGALVLTMPSSGSTTWYTNVRCNGPT